MSATPDKRAVVLVVDDDADIRLALEMLLQFEGFEVWTAKDGEEAWKRLQLEPVGPAVVMTDLKMPKMDGMQLLEKIVSMPKPPPVVMISGHGDVPVAVGAMKIGAASFLEKPLDDSRVLLTLRSVIREGQLSEENTGLRKQLQQRWELIGESDEMLQLENEIRQVAGADAAVLITGENGCGKELVARNLHYRGPRATGPFVTVNCAAIPHELIESELFGHEKGSFTGAHDRRTGHFEAASGGTLFLDEIGDMPIGAQAKVLRALESHEITRVGDSKSIPVDIRVLAATNADLGAAVEEKTFRLDLFYRLNVVPMRVPALRERLDDIPLLVERFLGQIAERQGRGPYAIERDAVQFLQRQSWPGNVRQLRNLLEAASVFAPDAPITTADLDRILASGPAMAQPASISGPGREDPFGVQTFEEFKNVSESLFFRMKLDLYEGNVKRTAEALGMQRSHLYKKLDRYELR